MRGQLLNWSCHWKLWYIRVRRRITNYDIEMPFNQLPATVNVESDAAAVAGLIVIEGNSVARWFHNITDSLHELDEAGLSVLKCLQDLWWTTS